MPLEVGTVVEGKVKSIAPFGAFVELPGPETGLVHISEIALNYVKDINEHLKVGDSAKVKVLSMDEKGKINLFIKKVLEEERKNVKKSSRPMDVNWGRQDSGPMGFEDMLSKFKQESDEKIQKLKLTKEPRRSRNG